MMDLQRRFSSLCAVLLCLAPLFVGCGGPSAEQDADFQKLFTSLEQMMDVLDTVKDPASAKAAKPQLDTLATQIRELHTTVKAMPEETRKALYEKHKDLVQRAGTKHSNQVLRQVRGSLSGDMFTYLMVVAEPLKNK